MLISINKIRETIGEKLWQAAVQIEQRGGVREESSVAEQAVYLIATDPPQRLIFKASEPPSCTCQMYLAKGCCIHIAAAALSAAHTGTLKRLEYIRAAASGPMLLDAMEAALPIESNVRMQVTLYVTCHEEKPSKSGAAAP